MDDGGRQSRRVLVAALLGTFVSLYPVLIVVAALPDIAADLGTSEATVAWVLTLPLLAGSVVLPTCGRLGDLHGHRKVFLLGLSISGAAAAMAALAWDPLSLIAFRSISQAAGTAVSPSAIALVISAHEPSERTRVLGFWASSTAVAPALGLLTGGPAVDAVSWRGLFVLQAVVALAVVPFAARALRETPAGRNVTFDVAGAAAFVVASGSLAFGLDRAGRWAWEHPAVVGSFVLCVLALVSFLRIERRARDPILPPPLLRNGSFLSSCGAELLVQVATNGALFVAPLVFHDGYDAGVGRIAWYMAPMPLGMSIVAPLGGRVARRIGERASSVVGFVLLAASLGAMVAADRAHQLGLFLVAWFVVGVANGFIRPAIASAAAAALDQSHYGAGMAATRMLSTVGAAAGITMAISLLPSGGSDLAFGACAVAGVLGVVASRWLHLPAAQPDEVAELELEVAITPGTGA